jgi:hypothetical protein
MTFDPAHQGVGLVVLARAVADAQDDHGVVPDPISDQIRVDDRKFAKSTGSFSTSLGMVGQAIGRRLQSASQPRRRWRIERRDVTVNALEIGDRFGGPNNLPH